MSASKRASSRLVIAMTRGWRRDREEHTGRRGVRERRSFEFQNSGIITRIGKMRAGGDAPVFANVRRLVIAHFALGLASVLVVWGRPGGFAPHFRFQGRGFALLVIINVFLAWIPYLVSGAYSSDLLPERSPRATIAFISIAVGVAVIAACLNLNLFGMHEFPPPWLVSIGVTIALIAAARLCAAIWRRDEPEWDSDL
jgi:hypothetical protein